MAEAEVRSWWIAKMFPDGTRCRLILRRGNSQNGAVIASYIGYINYRRNAIAAYREEYAEDCPGKAVVGLYDEAKWAVPPTTPKVKEPEKEIPVRVVRHRLPDCPGQIAIDFN